MWILVDGANTAVRYWYGMGEENATPLLVAKKVVSTIQRRLASNKEIRGAIALEGIGKPFRDRIYSDYKNKQSNPRPPIAKKIQPFLGMVAYEAGIPLRTSFEYEADDVLATMVKRIREDDPGVPIDIWSNDMDLWALIGPGIRIKSGRKTIGPEEVVSKFGVPPKQLSKLKALMGDTSDGIPGVSGVGPARGSRALQEAGWSLENIVATPEKYGLEKYDVDERVLDWYQLTQLYDEVDIFPPAPKIFADKIQKRSRQQQT